MSEPRRLLEGGGSDLERTILRSARADAPSPTSQRKTLIVLGLASSVGAAVTTTTVASTATTAAVKSVGTLALLKWIGAGVVGGLITLGAIHVVAPPEPPPITVAAKGVAPQVEQRRAAAPPPETAPPAPPPAPSVEEAPPPKPSAAPVLARPAPTSLTEEVAALDTAREALAAGDASRTLRALDEHDRRFPGGMLGPEATVLRIEALALRGDRAGAARLGAAFLDAHPRSPHAARLRTLLGITSGEAPRAPPPPVTMGETPKPPPPPAPAP